MNPYLLALAGVVVLLVLAMYVWWRQGWTPFSGKLGDSMSWSAPGQLSHLRFRNCTFSVVRLDGKSAELDVTGILNSMAAAYATAPAGQALPPALSLSAPLNAFSFVIPGFNDRATVPDPGVAPWCSAPPAAGQTVCPGCQVTLTGEFRVV